MTPLNQTTFNAMLSELMDQRASLGNRAMQLAADNAHLKEQVEKLTKRVAELEKPAPQ
jgi:ubiquinone biosynthesis protein UbiJ